MRINHNIASLNTYRQLSANNNATSKSLEKLSSGLAINRAGDNAAGLAISEKMRSQIRGLDQASTNAQDGISLIQTAEGALSETHSILQRMRELSVQSANDTNTADDRSEIQKEVDQLATEITRIANDTEFNTQALLNGGVTAAGVGANTFHIGANSNQSMDVTIAAMDAFSLGVARDATVTTATKAGTADDIGTVTLGDTVGAGVVNGASISFTYAAGGAGSAATLTAGGLTATASANDDAYNGYTLSVLDNATEGIAVNHTAKTIAISLNITGGSGTDISTLTATETGTNPGTGAFTFSGNEGTATTGTTGTTAGGVDAGSASVTVTDGTTPQTVAVADAAATSFAVTTGRYSGISLSLTTGSTVADLDGDSIDVASTTTTATAATFTAGAFTSKAVTAAGIDVSTKTAANSAITTIESAITSVSAERSKLGAYQNRLEHTINNLGTSSENLTAAESRIRDVDMAKEMMSYTKNNILSQAATAMLAQANQQPQGVLQLLQ